MLTKWGSHNPFLGLLSLNGECGSENSEKHTFPAYYNRYYKREGGEGMQASVPSPGMPPSRSLHLFRSEEALQSPSLGVLMKSALHRYDQNKM
jgi:hypothetical protein